LGPKDSQVRGLGNFHLAFHRPRLLTFIGVALIPICLGTGLFRIGAPAKIDAQRNRTRGVRREFLRFGAAMLPPVFTLSLTGIAMAQLNNVRVRRFVLPIVDLPKELDGMTVAQVSDMHVGRFTKRRSAQEDRAPR